MLLPPLVNSALVVVLAFLLGLGFKWAGVDVSMEVLMTIAAAIVAKIFGDALTAPVVNSIRGIRGAKE